MPYLVSFRNMSTRVVQLMISAHPVMQFNVFICDVTLSLLRNIFMGCVVMSNYTAPPFSPDPTYYPLPSYTLVVHKQGSLLHSIPLPTDVSFLVIGRGEGCELEIEHASSSRYNHRDVLV